MRRVWQSFVQQLVTNLIDNDTGQDAHTSLGLTEAVEQARREWLNARAYFETVSDPELVDHAIYLIDAAEKKYSYLLRKAKTEGITTGLQS